MPTVRVDTLPESDANSKLRLLNIIIVRAAGGGYTAIYCLINPRFVQPLSHHYSTARNCLCNLRAAKLENLKKNLSHCDIRDVVYYLLLVTPISFGEVFIVIRIIIKLSHKGKQF